MTKDDWVAEALTDDTMVVELLFCLKQSSTDSSYTSLQPKLPPSVLPPLRWGHRQPRSKPPTTVTKERQPTRCSPTTPLSWSGGGHASVSDGYDESSRLFDCYSAGRSKVTFGNESETTTTHKRSRKKTFAELKEEESFLLKERIYLKKELASIRVNLEEQRARSVYLERITLDLHVQPGYKMFATSDEPVASLPNQHNEVEPSTIDHALSILTRHSTCDHVALSDSCMVQKDAETRERHFILPDLNMTPFEEECPDSLYGMS